MPYVSAPDHFLLASQLTPGGLQPGVHGPDQQPGSSIVLRLLAEVCMGDPVRGQEKARHVLGAYPLLAQGLTAQSQLFTPSHPLSSFPCHHS